jgi:thiamine-phosphate pyrophosphorylase
VTDRRALDANRSSSALASLARRIEALAAAGIDWIQIREKDLAAKEIAALARVVLRRSNADVVDVKPRMVINDRLDVASAVGAGGVHLGENSLPAREARSLVENLGVTDFLVGVSCHSVESAIAAVHDGADYIFFGPVFATPSKATYGAPHGTARLAEACRSVSSPVIAIGGITLENAGACFAAGAAGIAAIRLFQQAADPAALFGALRAASK